MVEHACVPRQAEQRVHRPCTTGTVNLGRTVRNIHVHRRLSTVPGQGAGRGVGFRHGEGAHARDGAAALDAAGARDRARGHEADHVHEAGGPDGPFADERGRARALAARRDRGWWARGREDAPRRDHRAAADDRWRAARDRPG